MVINIRRDCTKYSLDEERKEIWKHVAFTTTSKTFLNYLDGEEFNHLLVFTLSSMLLRAFHHFSLVSGGGR